MGRRYRGVPNGQRVRGIYEPVVTNFIAHPVVTAKVNARGTTRLVWNSGSDTYEAR